MWAPLSRFAATGALAVAATAGLWSAAAAAAAADDPTVVQATVRAGWAPPPIEAEVAEALAATAVDRDEAGFWAFFGATLDGGGAVIYSTAQPPRAHWLARLSTR
jgi:hypothetical protein